MKLINLKVDVTEFNMTQPLDRSHFKEEDQLLYGIHEKEGILEIKIHNPKKKNAFAGNTQMKFTEIFTNANTDDRIKVIVIHGG
jgi:enoyl-CoA hydratase/carnithine racemase